VKRFKLIFSVLVATMTSINSVLLSSVRENEFPNRIQQN